MSDQARGIGVASILKWILATNILFGAALVFRVAQGANTDTHISQFESDTREIERMILDPYHPAVSLEDRRRFARELFPKMSEQDILKMTGDR